ncbi:response regulator [Cohnella thailandensis]|uniref:response regulator n=1 Tax=Cohnella thailandensis TaxID=557557 RepID=UPI001D372F52|nr:helix-turn-helix domain-containing protein [Cohnella thailandensis]MBP1975054.1 two-component system response regulator YesN [Cohnella thailandensis]
MIQALIVDDEPLHIQGLLRHVDWRRLGYEVPFTAESGDDALAILDDKKIDVLITDVSMPGMTGIELLARCKSDFPHLQSLLTLMISGYDEFEFVQEAIHLGAKAYVLKPIKTEEIEEKLASFRTTIEKRDQIERETTLLKEKVTGSLDVVQDRFVNDLIEGRAHDGALMESWSRLLDLPLGVEHIRMFLIGYDRLDLAGAPDARRRILLADGLLKTVKIGLSGWEGTYIGKTGADEAAVLHLNAEPSDRARMEKQLQFVQEVIREQYDASVTIGVSRECYDWEEIPLLYKEIKHMMANARLGGGGRILYFDRVEAEDYQEYRLKEEDVPEIVRLLERGEGEKAIVRFNHAFDLLLTQKPVSYSYVQAFAMGLISELARKIGLEKQEDGDENILIWKRLIDCTGTEEIRDAVLEYMARFGRTNRREEPGLQHNLIRRIAEYIGDHLQDHMTVKQLAEQFHLNASYLSVLFKKETGRTISDFVQEARMNKAKDLLRDPNVKIYEVAEQVGFQTAAYFAYLFKKVTGTTPQEYRDYNDSTS